MSTASVETRYTPEDLLRMGHGPRYELINGQLVERNMGAEANRVAAILVCLLNSYATAHKLGLVFTPSGYQIFADDPNRVRYPDVSFIRSGRLPGDRPPKGHIRIPPDLAIEVVSPNDLAEDVEARVEDFLQAGVALVWVIYPSTRRVLVFRRAGPCSRLTEADALEGDQVLPGFACKVGDLFAGL